MPPKQLREKYIMSDLILESVKNKAIQEVAEFIKLKAKECQARGWSFVATSDAPESFKALKASVFNGCIPVADYGCDKSIYGEPMTNIIFRFWHDVTHLELDSGFSVAGETTVIEAHLSEAREANLSPLAMRILYADTIGQVLYYDKYKQFVDCQDAWLDSCLAHGVKKALGFKH